MIRILGVITGAGIAIALLTWLVGVPQFTSKRVDSPPPIRIVELPEPKLAAEENLSEPLPAPVDIAEAPPAETPASEQATEVVVELPPDPDPVIPPAAETQWFAFWSPFRSEIAAEGFVSQLQRVTGLDYRVVKIKTGVYEVAFAYTDDTEIDNNLSTISAATGLDLPGSP